MDHHHQIVIIEPETDPMLERTGSIAERIRPFLEAGLGGLIFNIPTGP
jgi:hypothetical protein